MRWLTVILIIFLLMLQYRLLVGEGSLAQKVALEKEVALQQEKNARLRDRNAILAREVEDLKSGLEAVEERARTDLGMIREGETFYMVIEDEAKEQAK